MGSADYLQAIKPDMGKLRKLVETSLLSDWIIRVEYMSAGSTAECWEQWGQSLFALKSADTVLAALKACYTNRPGCVIRINAEKVRPQTRMLYTAYRPRHKMPEMDSKPQVVIQTYAGDASYIHV